ncbi:MAG TPA: hypothetical protein DDW34_14960 [Clostridium sp.]|nr:hypothetical protein [Clostridium sp.]
MYFLSNLLQNVLEWKTHVQIMKKMSVQKKLFWVFLLTLTKKFIYNCCTRKKRFFIQQYNLNFEVELEGGI